MKKCNEMECPQFEAVIENLYVADKLLFDIAQRQDNQTEIDQRLKDYANGVHHKCHSEV